MVHKTPVKRLSLALTLAGAAASAAATPVLVTQTFTFNSLLNQGNAGLSGAFNINALAAQLGVTDLSVLSANIVAYGFSNAQYDQNYQNSYYDGGNTNNYSTGTWVNSGYTSYSWSSGCWNGCWINTSHTEWVAATDHYNYRTNVTTHTDNTVDRLQVAVAGTTRTVQDAYQSSSTQPSQYQQSAVYNNGQNGHDFYYDRYADSYNGYSGALDLNITLTAAELLDLQHDGAIGYVVSAGTGNFTFQNLTLRALVDQAVPEPGSLATIGVGLAALIMVQRQRRGRRTKAKAYLA